MQAPKGVNSANILGQEYDIPKNGIITVKNEDHVEVLKRHGFVEAPDDPRAVAKQIEEMDDKDDLVEFIEERGGEADNSMGLKKLKRLAREAANVEE